MVLVVLVVAVVVVVVVRAGWTHQGPDHPCPTYNSPL